MKRPPMKRKSSPRFAVGAIVTLADQMTAVHDDEPPIKPGDRLRVTGCSGIGTAKRPYRYGVEREQDAPSTGCAWVFREDEIQRAPKTPAEVAAESLAMVALTRELVLCEVRREAAKLRAEARSLAGNVEDLSARLRSAAEGDLLGIASVLREAQAASELREQCLALHHLADLVRIHDQFQTRAEGAEVVPEIDA